MVDYGKLNENTVEKRYPLPRLKDTLGWLAGVRFFSTLDLKSGLIVTYPQVRMKEQDIAKTAFTFGQGHYFIQDIQEFTTLPFKPKNASLTFQRVMDEIIRGLGERYCKKYMDDLIVFNPSLSSHLNHLKLVFERVRKLGQG